MHFTDPNTLNTYTDHAKQNDPINYEYDQGYNDYEPMGSKDETPDSTHEAGNRFFGGSEPNQYPQNGLQGVSQNDPVSSFVKAFALMLFAAGAFAVPKSLAPLWMILSGAVVVGGIGVELFYAWALTASNNLDVSNLSWILWLTTALFAAFVIALFAYLIIHLMRISNQNRIQKMDDDGELENNQEQTTHQPHAYMAPE